MVENIFEYAVRNKLRFNFKGQLTVEDLWDLSVVELDSIFKALKEKEKTESCDSLLINEHNNTELSVSIEIIKYIVAEKLKAIEEAKYQAKRKAEKQEILSILKDKQNEALKNLSIEELENKLKEIE